ncbi:restriction endonuclease subunit S [Stenotrophomonas maltophilia]|uniref:restriction endonuclease subunit S n=1 Tax=Stenotrophomonas maltophilia TaxID=40324 RepID=UPI00255621DF|nr:restriction endonuclease subunit S [Stenotrophomonas maltophilia]
MIGAKFLEILLEGVAVEWAEVGELIPPRRGKRLVKSQLDEVGSYAVYQNSLKPLGYYHEGNAPAGVAFLVVAGAAGDVGFSDAAFWAADDVYFFAKSNAVNSKYLYYFLLTKQHEISSQVRRASIPRLSISAVEKLHVPIPCPENPKKSLKIQAEIVRILDALTELTTELTAELAAELAARKKQYSYYRDRLLSFEDGDAEWKPLGDLFPFIRNGFVGTVTPYYTDAESGIRYLQGTNIQKGSINDKNEYYITREFHDKCARTKLKIDDILVVQSGHVGESAVVGDKYKDCNCHALIVMSNGGGCNSKFINYFLQSAEGKSRLAKITTGGTVKHVLASKIKKLEVPVPALSKQVRIVAILEKFDILINSLSEGLPREIELLQKQYEYYRDLLLSFPRSEGAEA